jgi:hypothetical protein
MPFGGVEINESRGVTMNLFALMVLFPLLSTGIFLLPFQLVSGGALLLPLLPFLSFLSFLEAIPQGTIFYTILFHFGPCLLGAQTGQ